MNDITKKILREAGLTRIRDGQYASISDHDIDALVKTLIRDAISTLKSEQIATRSLVTIETVLKQRYGIE